MHPNDVQVIFLEDHRDYLTYRPGSGNTVEIFDIAVGTDRRTGQGRRLIGLLLARMRGETHLVWALTRVSNKIAHEFYEALGFRLLGTLPGFYAEEDARLYGVIP